MLMLQVVTFQGDASRFKPAHCIAVREATQQVLVVLRGTGQLSDALTNLAGQRAARSCSRHAALQCCSASCNRMNHAGARLALTISSHALAGVSTQFQGGQAHEGMLRSAQWLLDGQLSKLSGLLQEHAGFQLRFIGHSLGAGTATLASMLLQVRLQSIEGAAAASYATHASWAQNKD